MFGAMNVLDADQATGATAVGCSHGRDELLPLSTGAGARASVHVSG
jgi:hypothetical protein